MTSRTLNAKTTTAQTYSMLINGGRKGVLTGP